jgi:hypothetical protein
MPIIECIKTEKQTSNYLKLKEVLDIKIIAKIYNVYEKKA